MKDNKDYISNPSLSSQQGCKVEGMKHAAVVECLFPRIPNISKFTLSKAEVDTNWELLGVRRNLPRTATFTLLKETDALNKYVMFQTNRLFSIKDPKVFFKIVRHLVLKSYAFYMVALMHTLPNWYWEMEWKEVKKLRNRFLRVARKDKFTLKRLYIPKADGSKRPLGIPTVPSRMVGFLYSKFLWIWLRERLPDHQHGYQPGKGVLTCWDDVLMQVIYAPYIFEFDLRNFFGSLNPDKLITELMDAEVFESPTMFETLWNYLSTPIYMGKSVVESVERKLRKLRLVSGADIILPHDYYELWKKKSEQTKAKDSRYYLGVPQGGNMSPLLSMLGLSRLESLVKSQGAKLLMYADDGLIYSKHPFDPNKIFFNKDLIEDGIVLQRAKSGWVRQGGVWLKDLLFLGLKYLWETDNLMSWTRRGVKMTFDKWEIFKALKASSKGKKKNEEYSVPTRKLNKALSGKFKQPSYFKWKGYVYSGLQGFIYSRLVQGEWNPETEIRKDGKFVRRVIRPKPKSWAFIYYKDVNKAPPISTMSSTAYQQLLAHLKGSGEERGLSEEVVLELSHGDLELEKEIHHSENDITEEKDLRGKSKWLPYMKGWDNLTQEERDLSISRFYIPVHHPEPKIDLVGIEKVRWVDVVLKPKYKTKYEPGDLTPLIVWKAPKTLAEEIRSLLHYANEAWGIVKRELQRNEATPPSLAVVVYDPQRYRSDLYYTLSLCYSAKIMK